MLALIATLLAACNGTSQEALLPPASSADAPAATPADDAGAAPVEESAGDGADTLVPTPTSDAAATDGADASAAPAPRFSPEETRIALESVATGLDQPLFVAGAGDGSSRLFVVEKPGRIRILQDGALQDAPFLDMVDLVNNRGNEQGLLGMAFAPNYSESGHFFVNYTDAEGATVVARYSVAVEDPNRADPASAFQIIRVAQPASNHNAGMLAFGPDGYLYLGMGDGGAANDRFGNGQNPETLLGKMLRLDVTSDPSRPYLIPDDNPWIAADWNGVDVRDEIWAVGLRNPWRYSFDRATGALWIGDVGQNQFEEINRMAATDPGGANYGWPIMEGTHCFPASASCDESGLVLPVFEYSHQGHCSVTGGYVYRGAAFPVLDGVYFYGDYCSGVIWAGWQDEGGVWQSAQVLDTSVSLASFGEDDAGELYVTDLSGGTVARLVVE